MNFDYEAPPVAKSQLVGLSEGALFQFQDEIFIILNQSTINCVETSIATVCLSVPVPFLHYFPKTEVVIPLVVKTPPRVAIKHPL